MNTAKGVNRIRLAFGRNNSVIEMKAHTKGPVWLVAALLWGVASSASVYATDSGSGIGSVSYSKSAIDSLNRQIASLSIPALGKAPAPPLARSLSYKGQTEQFKSNAFRPNGNGKFTIKNVLNGIIRFPRRKLSAFIDGFNSVTMLRSSQELGQEGDRAVAGRIRLPDPQHLVGLKIADFKKGGMIGFGNHGLNYAITFKY